MQDDASVILYSSYSSTLIARKFHQCTARAVGHSLWNHACPSADELYIYDIMSYIALRRQISRGSIGYYLQAY